MRALEFKPISEGDFPSSSLNPSSTSTTSTPELEDLDINSLYKLSLKISQGKDNHHYSGEELKTLDTLISTGTSAGGR